MKVEIYVKEIVYHKVTVELPEEEMKELINELDSIRCNDVAGDLCNNLTGYDGEWELDYYDLKMSE